MYVFVYMICFNRHTDEFDAQTSTVLHGFVFSRWNEVDEVQCFFCLKGESYLQSLNSFYLRCTCTICALMRYERDLCKI